MLMQPTIEKLHSMKLFGMAEAIRRQTEDPVPGEFLKSRGDRRLIQSATVLLPPVRSKV